MPFEKVADEFIGKVNKLKKYAGARRAAHNYNMTAHLLPVFKGKPIDGIFARDVRKLVDRMEDAGAAASSINNALSTLRKLFEYATDEYIDEGDIPHIKNVSLEDQEPRATFNEAEIEAIVDALCEEWGKAVDAAKGDTAEDIIRDKAVRRTFELFQFVNLMAATGMRPSTIGRLRAGDVVIVDKKKSRVAIRAETRKGRKVRRWEVQVRRTGTGNLLLLVENAEPSDPLFTISPNHLSRLFSAFLDGPGRKFALDAHGRRRTIYSVRHFYINHMLESGAKTSVVAKNAMTSLQMIERYYEHIDTRDHSDDLAQDEGWVDDEDVPEDLVPNGP
jgi:integrase